MDKLNTELRDQAMRLGLCNKFQEEWSCNKTIDELADMYIRGIEFVIQNNYPTLEYLERNFSKEFMNEHHIYLNDEINGGLSNGIFVFNGKCTGKLNIRRFTTCRLYIRHDCDISICTSEYAKVFIELYDNAKISVIQNGKSSVVVYKKNKNASIVGIGNVIIRNHAK